MPVVTDGGIGLGVNPDGTKFPFVNPSDDVKGLFADFSLTHSVRAAVLPLRIVWLYGMCRAQEACTSGSSLSSGVPEPVHEADLLVADADGNIIFDSTTATVFRSRSWGSRFHVYAWQTDSAVCQAILHTGAHDAEDAKAFLHDFRPENGVLDERCSEITPRSVTRITVDSTDVTESFQLEAGYNITLEPGELSGSSRRARQSVVISAVPGSGQGRFPGCVEEDLLVKTINGVAPNAHGDFTITVGSKQPTGGTCYWLERPSTLESTSPRIARPTAATLKLHNNCSPCCECEDYVNTYRGIRRLYDRFKSIGGRTDTVKSQFRENAARWIAQRDCRKGHPTRIAAVLSGLGYLDIAAAFCNTTAECMSSVQLDLSFVHSAGQTGSAVDYSTLISTEVGDGGMVEYTLLGSWPSYQSNWATLSSGRSAKIRTRFYFPNSLTGHTVTITATPSVGGNGYPSALITKSLV